VSVLGQNDGVLEYQPKVVLKATWQQESDGLHIRATHARLVDNRRWPDPIVLKITDAKPAVGPQSRSRCYSAILSEANDPAPLHEASRHSRESGNPLSL
jgi:alpha-L-fucosidase